MSKKVYIIISDLHASYKNKDSRYNYPKEIDYVVSEIIKLGLNYKNRGYDVVLIFLGDIADNSYKDQTQAILLNNIFVKFKDLFFRVCSVIGNHELSYYKDNPFWTLMSKISSNKVKGILNRTWQARGLLQLIDVPDVIEDGEVVFHFNHYSTGIARPYGNKINIGLFHQDITSKAIVEDMKLNKGLDVFEGNPIYFDKTNALYGYDYAFIGHNHKLYGQWTYIDDDTNFKTEIYHLASLGRPNHTEVSNNFLERNLPAILVEDGKFIGVEDNKFNLMSREETVKELVIQQKQEVYQENKQKNLMITYNSNTDNPISNIESMLVGYPASLQLFKEYVASDSVETEAELNKKLGRAKWM